MHTAYDYSAYWERCWNEEDEDALFRWLDGWNRSASEEMEFLKSRGVKTVCDAACGFGAHTLAFASNGFEVSAFDISPKAAALTREGLRKYGYGGVEVKTADILDTGYADASFDAAAAYAVLDHLTGADARRALAELSRITKPGGWILLSFDEAEEDDCLCPHELLSDGSMVYSDETPRSGLLFRPHDKGRIEELTAGYQLVRQDRNQKGDQIVLLHNETRP
ncbi:MAG: class I SAM-dependent methyltransferase [Ruminococcaceae bacterium]|nr:class I SAM-dependent methyltransferase [Oscillospiraceae bacterium]